MSYRSGTVKVTSLSQILLLPLRLEYHGRFDKDWRDQNVSSAERLYRRAEWITSHPADGRRNTWTRDKDLYESLALFPGGSLDPRDDPADSYATAVYFHPFIRDLLFARPEHQSSAEATGSKAFEVLESRSVRGVRMTLAGTSAPETRAFRVRRCHLFLFPSEIAILTLQAEWSLSCGEPKMSVGESHDLLNRFRRLYPPYFIGSSPAEVLDTVSWLDESGDTLNSVCGVGATGLSQSVEEGKTLVREVSASRQPQMAAHWRWLLGPLTETKPSVADSITIRQVLDDRIPSMIFVSLHPIRALSKADLARFIFLDASAPTGEFSYSPEFARLEPYLYDRFWKPSAPENLTTRFVCSGYNFGLLVSSRDGFADSVLRKHFERHYFFLGLMVWLQKAAFLSFWDRLAQIVNLYSGEKPDEKPTETSRQAYSEQVKWLLEDLADFIARFHFSEVSNQLQALELFGLWSRHLGIEQLRAQLLEQSKLLREIQMGHWQQKLQEQSKNLQRAANWWLPATVMLSLLSFVTIENFYKFFKGIWDTAFLLYMILSVAVIVCIIYAPLWLPGLRRIARKGMRMDRERD